MPRRDPIRNTPIERAVRPMKEAAMDNAETALIARIKHVHEQLAAADWKLNDYAPRPDSHMSRARYQMASAKRSFAESITAADPRASEYRHELYEPSYLWQTNPCRRVACDQPTIDRIIEVVRSMAAQQYEAYVWKLHDKIGTVETASITEVNGLWNWSHLTVEKAGGVTEVWHTQMILNYSVYGLPFNQFPTRKLKR